MAVKDKVYGALRSLIASLSRRVENECQLCDNLCTGQLCDECNQLTLDIKEKYAAFYGSEES